MTRSQQLFLLLLTSLLWLSSCSSPRPHEVFWRVCGLDGQCILDCWKDAEKNHLDPDTCDEINQVAERNL